MRRMMLLMLVVLLTSGCAKVIDDGEAGVRFDLGKVAPKPVPAGLTFYVPVVSRIERWNVKTIEIKETANVPSSEGLISTLDVSVLLRVPAENVVKVRKNIGPRYISIVVIPNARDTIRSVVSGYQVKALFSEQGRTEIAQKLQNQLKEKLAPKGIIVQDALLRDVRLPPTFAKSIEAKLKAEQESLQKQFELEKAKKDAEIEIARAHGVAESNRIIADSLSENYLRYRWIEGLHTNSAQVIYVPTEANLPILEADRFEAK